MRERLVKLLKDTPHLDVLYGHDIEWEKAADHLLANGVIVPPVKVGDTVYWLDNRVIKGNTVYEISIHSDGILIHTGTRLNLTIEEVFTSRAEAEKALAGMNKEGENED